MLSLTPSFLQRCLEPAQEGVILVGGVFYVILVLFAMDVAHTFDVVCGAEFNSEFHLVWGHEVSQFLRLLEYEPHWILQRSHITTHRAATYLLLTTMVFRRALEMSPGMRPL